MNIFTKLIVAFAALFVPVMASAQMSIEDTSAQSRRNKSFADSIRVQKVKHNYYSEALYRHQRKLVRQERNALEISSALQGSLTNLSDSWIETSGGDNSVTLLTSLFIKHKFKKNNFTLDSYFGAKFGYYHMVLDEDGDNGETLRNPVWYKNQDEFQFSITPSIILSKNWSYGASIKFRSQFTKGYVSSSSQEDYNLKSDFLSPAYLDVSGGLIYNSPNKKYPFKVTLSPLAMSAIYVTSKEVMENAQFQYKEHTDGNAKYVEPYGVEPNSSSKYEGGFSVQVDFDKYFDKKKAIRYSTSLFSFYGWMSQITAKNVFRNPTEFETALDEWNGTKEGDKPMLSIHPTLRWENRIELKATKLLSTTLNFQLYYNRAQNVKIQTQTLLSVGLAYKFTSK